jgi:hypothetical protein
MYNKQSLKLKARKKFSKMKNQPAVGLSLTLKIISRDRYSRRPAKVLWVYEQNSG